MTGPDCDGWQAIQETIENPCGGLAESLACTGPKTGNTAFVGIPTCGGEAAQDAYGSDSGKHREVVTVDLIFQGTLAHLIESVKFQRHPASIGQDEPMETHGQPRLILVRHGCRRADHPRPSRDQHPLPVRRIERHGNDSQHRTGEVTGKLRD